MKQNETATDAELGKLHKKLAQTLMAAIEPREIAEVNEDGERHVLRVEYPSPGLLAVVAKFLKDNAITASIETDEQLAALQARLQKNNRMPSEKDMKDALSTMGARLLN